MIAISVMNGEPMDISEMGKRDLFAVVEPWINDSVYDGLSDEEAQAMAKRILDEFGLEYVLKPNAPEEAMEAYCRLQDLAKRTRETGELSE